MEADKAAAAAQKNGSAHSNGTSSSSSKDSDITPEKKSRKKKGAWHNYWNSPWFWLIIFINCLLGAERNKGTGKWKLCPTVMNSNVETPGTYSPPANAPSRNKKK
jgi:hypothetical protein